MDLRTQGNPTTRNLEPPWGRVSYLRLIFETFHVLSRCRYATQQCRKTNLKRPNSS
jgi:hypothetical protein